MVPSRAQDLIEELNATQKRYGKKKLAFGGYSGWYHINTY